MQIRHWMDHPYYTIGWTVYIISGPLAELVNVNEYG